jgi:hypothetical protein
MPRPRRWLVQLVSALAVTVPFALQLLGVGPASYVFDARGMVVVPGALALPAVPTMTALALASLALVFVSVTATSHIRDVLGDVERRLMVHTWHMRELAPAAAVVSGGTPPAPAPRQ